MNNLIEITINNGILNQINAIIIHKYNICYLNDKKYQISDELLGYYPFNYQELKDILGELNGR